MIDQFAYVGEELDIFAHANRWKNYWASRIRPYLGGEVLEVGAGIGTNTEILCSNNQKRWVCLEPDQKLLRVLAERVARCQFRTSVETRVGRVQDLAVSVRFDTVIYIDVLEHIENDQQELESASQLLNDGGTLVVLAPAHQWLFSPFDKAIGHFRRYNRETLARAGPSRLCLEQMFYLDSAGLLASAANLILLQQRMPSVKQIQFWDRWLVPLSKKVDSCLAYRIGKTVVGIWRKDR